MKIVNLVELIERGFVLQLRDYLDVSIQSGQKIVVPRFKEFDNEEDMIVFRNQFLCGLFSAKENHKKFKNLMREIDNGIHLPFSIYQIGVKTYLEIMDKPCHIMTAPRVVEFS